MVKKNDLNKSFERFGVMMKRFGDDLGRAAKKGEKEVVKMSKRFKIQLDLMGVALQKEKLYHEIGKEVSEKLLKEELDISGLDKYKKRLVKFDAEGKKMKKALSRGSGTRKKSASKKAK